MNSPFFAVFVIFCKQQIRSYRENSNDKTLRSFFNESYFRDLWEEAKALFYTQIAAGKLQNSDVFCMNGSRW